LLENVLGEYLILGDCFNQVDGSGASVVCSIITGLSMTEDNKAKLALL
jgi:hypothetical protein